jgi:hypothetical protein
MTHDNCLYMIEFYLKRGDIEAAEQQVSIMNAEKNYQEPASVIAARQRIIDAGFKPEYI